MSIVQFLRILWARRWLIGFCPLFTLLGGLVVVLLAQPRYEAMAARVSDKLGFGGTTQKPAEIITELGSAQTALDRAKDRHQSTKDYLTTTLSGVQNVTTEEVATQILALQTQLQASYQVTSMLSKLTLTNYL